MASDKPPGSPGSPTLADCSGAVCAALRQLQEGYAAAQARIQELQVGLRSRCICQGLSHG
jgi:hypothetical protein